MNLRRLVFLILALPGLPSAAPVKIGVINSMTGPEAPIGEHITNGIKLASEDLKEKGTSVDIVWEDDIGKPQVGLSAIEKLVTRDNVAAVLGAYTSAVTIAVARKAEQYQVPLVVPVAAADKITRQGYKWVFRVAATTSDYASILLDMATALGKPTSIAILVENTDFGVSGSNAAKAYAEKKGIKVVFDGAYSAGSPDYRSTLLKLKSTKPDLVYMVSYVVDAILLMRQSREVGLSPLAFLGAGPGFMSAQFAQEQSISNGVFGIAQWAPDVSWPGTKRFAERYEKRFGKAPTYPAANAYAAMLILGETAVKAGGDRAHIAKALADGKFSGILGEVAFRDYDGYTNQNKHPVVVEQVQASKYVTVWPGEYASSKPSWPFPGWK
jgi:branched-chain amino acid transport system substrate-binding protein